MRTLKIVVNDADRARLAPASLRTLDDLQFEQALEAVRRERVETERAEEAVKEFGFRRIVLVVVLCILGLGAVGSLAVIVTGVVTGLYPLAAGAVVSLSGSGGLSVLAWRTHTGNAPCEEIENRA
ncbi:MAG TPA: hypothetical protein VGW80_02565 [Solirubrobacterales bacterium]|nr:hypothetical protein [Solirubrobacterales bacterium]